MTRTATADRYVSTDLPRLHVTILHPIQPGPARVRKRAFARQMPSKALKAVLMLARRDLTGSPYGSATPTYTARVALEAARARAALAARGEPVAARMPSVRRVMERVG